MTGECVVDILLVEDNQQDAELMIRAIRKRHLANPVHVVADGAEALDFLFCRGPYADRDFSKPPKLVMLDLKLPKVSGLEVLKAIKEDRTLRALPVVIVTSSREDPDIASAYALGANSYVVKPVDFDEFLDAISRVELYWLLVNQPPSGA